MREINLWLLNFSRIDILQGSAGRAGVEYRLTSTTALLYTGNLIYVFGRCFFEKIRALVVPALCYQQREDRCFRTSISLDFAFSPRSSLSLNLARCTVRYQYQSSMYPQHPYPLFRTLSLVFFSQPRYADASAHEALYNRDRKSKSLHDLKVRPTLSLRSGSLSHKDPDPGF